MMSHIKKCSLWLLGIVGLLTAIYGCSSASKNMSSGEVLYRSKCSSCHNTIAPAEHDSESWRLYVNKYGQDMTSGEKEKVLQYLVSPDQLPAGLRLDTSE